MHLFCMLHFYMKNCDVIIASFFSFNKLQTHKNWIREQNKILLCVCVCVLVSLAMANYLWEYFLRAFNGSLCDLLSPPLHYFASELDKINLNLLAFNFHAIYNEKLWKAIKLCSIFCINYNSLRPR